MFRSFISSFRLRRKHRRPKRNISDKYPFLLEDLADQVGRVDLVDHRCQGVRVGLWDLWDRVGQLRHLCLGLLLDQGDRVGRHLQHLQVRRAQSVGFEQGYQHRRVVRRYQLDLVDQVGQVVRVVQVEHRYLDDQGYLGLRDLRVDQGDQVDQEDLVDTVCTVVA
jgi:hypothetical protein